MNGGSTFSTTVGYLGFRNADGPTRPIRPSVSQLGINFGQVLIEPRFHWQHLRKERTNDHTLPKTGARRWSKLLILPSAGLLQMKSHGVDGPAAALTSPRMVVRVEC